MDDKLADLVSELRSRGVVFTLEGDRVRVTGWRSITAAEKAILRAHRADLVEILARESEFAELRQGDLRPIDQKLISPIDRSIERSTISQSEPDPDWIARKLARRRMLRERLAWRRLLEQSVPVESLIDRLNLPAAPPPKPTPKRPRPMPVEIAHRIRNTRRRG